MLNPKYNKLIDLLNKKGDGDMVVRGNSMTPIIESGSLLSFSKDSDYEIGDVAFCKVKGRVIDAHLITSKSPKRGWLISNNHGYDNGWTKTIYGRVTAINGKPYGRKSCGK